MSKFNNKDELFEFLLNSNEYKDECLDLYPFPKPYHPDDLSKVKAVVIGCDPSDGKGTEFDYVFGLEDEDSQYFQRTLDNLKQIGLDLDDIYVQNLCQNYCNNVTNENDKYVDIAELWVPFLKKELDKLDELIGKTIPAFITGAKVRDVLYYGNKSEPYNKHYKEVKFIKPSENKLNRTLIPLYRHDNRSDYYLISNTKWEKYKNKIESTFEIRKTIGVK